MTDREEVLTNVLEALYEAIQANLMPCNAVGIDTTGAYVKQQYISEEMENAFTTLNWVGRSVL
jgi:hypothetical protein